VAKNAFQLTLCLKFTTDKAKKSIKITHGCYLRYFV